ncbi:MAG: hypothetical protein WCG95_00005 [bacterium]
MKIDFKQVAMASFAQAANMADLTGEERMDYAINLIVTLDNSTPLVIIPDKLEAMALKKLCQKVYEEWKEHHKVKETV